MQQTFNEEIDSFKDEISEVLKYFIVDKLKTQEEKGELKKYQTKAEYYANPVKEMETPTSETDV